MRKDIKYGNKIDNKKLVSIIDLIKDIKFYINRYKRNNSICDFSLKIRGPVLVVDSFDSV